jgi:hypothetical protein
MILRLLNPQGIAGIAASLCLAILLILQKGETRHWTKQSAQFEQLYRNEQSAFATTVANARAAAETARAADKANADRVAAEQSNINHRSENALETRLADARARAQRLRVQPQAGTNPGAGGNTSMPRLSAAAGSIGQAAVEDRLPDAPSGELETGDALTATEQAIQLDELIKWVRAQTRLDPNAPPAGRP